MTSPADILLCADLDRTILPNGSQPESPRARPLLRALAARPEVSLAYVTGRHRALIEAAIAQYRIPVPDYAIGDVGTTIYRIRDGAWEAWDRWAQEIAPDWQGRTQADLARLLDGLDGLELQEAEKQNVHKLSYYAPEDTDREALGAEVRARLDAEGVRASIIWSIDEAEHTGLLDVLPKSATKVHAVRFLMEELGFPIERTVFAGDSGNDLPALTSDLQAVLVRNARDDVRAEAVEQAESEGLSGRLYLARGDFLGMNGHYTAGVLEGVAHYLPEVASWLAAARHEPVSD